MRAVRKDDATTVGQAGLAHLMPGDSDRFLKFFFFGVEDLDILPGTRVVYELYCMVTRDFFQCAGRPLRKPMQSTQTARTKIQCSLNKQHVTQLANSRVSHQRAGKALRFNPSLPPSEPAFYPTSSVRLTLRARCSSLHHQHQQLQQSPHIFE